MSKLLETLNVSGEKLDMTRVLDVEFAAAPETPEDHENAGLVGLEELESR